MDSIMKFMPLKFKRKERISVGLDIGTQTIKIVELKFRQDAVELQGFNLWRVHSDLGKDLKEITHSKEIKKVNVSVCGPSAITRYVNFPKMSPDELRSALKFEAQKYIPFSVSEANLDSCILKPSLPDNKMLVLIVAVKKEIINQRLKLLAEAGISVNKLEVDSTALINAFNFNYSMDPAFRTKTVGLLNIGSTFTNLNILENGIPCLSRDIQIAGNNFTQKLQEVFGLDFESAEALKPEPEKQSLDKLIQGLEPVFSNLANEVRTSFDYYENQSACSVEKIFLSGAGSLLNGLKDKLANLLSINVEYWDPLKEINIRDGIDKEEVKGKSMQLALAIGLALRS